MKKKYYRLSEAAELLSSRHGHRLTDFDILEMGARGEIRLCIWFDGTVAKFKDVGPLDSPALVGPPYSFRGYVRIPLNVIDPYGGDVQFDAAAIVEVVGAPYGEEQPPEVDWPEFYGEYEVVQETGEIVHVPFHTNCAGAVVPASDLERGDGGANDGAPEVRRKRSALVRELQDRWPDIESDLRHADENGLKNAAKLPDHGIWDLSAAVKWAEEHGKLSNPTTTQELDPLETLNRLSMVKRRL